MDVNSNHHVLLLLNFGGSSREPIEGSTVAGSSVAVGTFNSSVAVVWSLRVVGTFNSSVAAMVVGMGMAGLSAVGIAVLQTENIRTLLLEKKKVDRLSLCARSASRLTVRASVP